MRFFRSTHQLMYLSLETLTSIIRTGLTILVELIDQVKSYNFSISNNLTQMVNFPTWIPDCDSHSPALLDLSISSYASICSTVAFPPLGNSDHGCLNFHLLSIIFQWDAPFDCIAYDYSCADWDGLHDHLRDVPWEDIFKLSASPPSEFCEWVQVGIDVDIPYQKYQVKLAYGNKTKESIISQKPSSWGFWQIANSVLNKGKSAIPPLFNGLEVLSSASDKAKLFAENFSRNSNLDDSGISLSVFSSRTNLKLHISLTPKMVKKVITNLDLSKAYGSDCIPVVVLKNCEPGHSYILAEPFNKCLKESCFPDCGKVSLVVPVFKNVGERCTAKNYCPFSLLSAVSKVLKNL